MDLIYNILSFINTRAFFVNKKYGCEMYKRDVDYFGQFIYDLNDQFSQF